MSDDEDPYAVSSDSDDDRPKGPPPKVAIEGAKDLKQLKEAILAGDEKKSVKDEKTMEEIEELRRAKTDEMKRMKQEFEEGTAGGKTAAEEAAAAQKESLEGVGKENLASMKNMFEKEPGKAFTAVDDEEKQRQLEEIKSQVSSVKQMWKTGHVEGASAAEVDGAKQEELDALKRGTNLKERFQPQAADGGEVQKCYDRSELDTAAIADARKSFVEGSAYQSSTKAESAAAGELGELKFTEMNAFKDRFEKAQGSNGADSEAIEKARIELDLQLKELRKNFEKPESEMSPEEQAAKKKAEIEAEFARYKLARKMAKAQADEDGAGAERWSSWIDETSRQIGDGRRRKRGQPRRRQRRLGGGGGVRREEPDEQVQDDGNRCGHDGGWQEEGDGPGGVGGAEDGGEEAARAVRAGQPHGELGAGRGEEAAAGGGVQAAQGRTGTCQEGAGGGTGRSGGRGSGGRREGGHPGGGGARVEDGREVGEDPEEGGQEGGEVEDAAEVMEEFVPAPSSPHPSLDCQHHFPPSNVPRHYFNFPPPFFALLRLFAAFMLGLAIGILLVPFLTSSQSQLST